MQIAAGRVITRDELAEHRNDGDLWISIQGKVYDVSKWAAIHPGGDLALKSFAGQPDATDAFLAFHPRQRAFQILPKFLIGTLADPVLSPLTADHALVLERLGKAGFLTVDLFFYCKILAAIVALVTACVAGVIFSSSAIVHCASAVLLGFAWIQAGWIGHDTGHTGMTGSPRADSWIGLLIGNALSGIGFQWWLRNHNAHHFSCNNLEYDPDLQYMPIFAISSRFFRSSRALHSYFYDREMAFDAIARLLVSYQHWTFYLVMAVARVNLYAQSFIVAIWRKRVPHRGWEIGSLLFFWAWLFSLLSYLPSYSERIAFLLIAMATTGVQHVQFCLNHFSSPVYQGRRPRGDGQWLADQATGTLNLSCSKKWDWFHGGLQFQIEHHLFPQVPRHHLRAASEMVIKPLLVDKHGLDYKMVTFWEANVMIIRTLRAAAMEARDVSKPLRKGNMLWEAVNAHG
ncbi:hypothetical protein SELMODRAFT_231254 [Selaginella moellendorffii]|uniref:Cytochrome b5 heme-binding domain-containing protein n=1 Tax=Selaginella moellendorffii TaxID=88036 RepID=D8RD08_SELML|nr:delta(8)-fatty-acid desaturase 2 [Selaginella moellendorffii]EFJ25110.1 hypothetical protein SELMODRAFT_100447 [Selaginella moellendorffii]EFJ29933.1 hypothetical protein SELMODRAFT_231254 [Selaginella moellendorffii]|eukprot:XP_002968817.1 delta(8)-fatty-acid desaturase 2 [Selaginella moellendorffii]